MARGEGRKNRATGTFGSVDELASGRYRARYFGPDGRRYKAPTLFLTKKAARSWLSLRQSEIITKAWMPPGADQAPALKLTLKAYADAWLPKRKVRGQPLKTRTREHYRNLLDDQILPKLGSLPIASITRDDVEDWYDANLDAATPTLRAHSYGLLKTIMSSAVAEGKVKLNPCVIKGAGTSKRVHKIQPVTIAEIETLTAEMPEPLQAMVLLASWCAMRFGELTELRRKDIKLIERTEKDKDGNDVEVREGLICVRRAVVRVEGGFKETTPKSDAGVRDIAIPPHLVPVLKAHLERHVGPEKDALLFPAKHGGYLAPATLYRHWYKARAAAGRENLRWHDLRHSGAVLAAQTGATLAELMARLGHSTPAAAMRYQHAARDADKRTAARLSALLEA